MAWADRVTSVRRRSLARWAARPSAEVWRMDGVLLVAVIALCVIGTLLVWSSTRTWAPDSTGLMKKHLLNVAIGATLMAVVAMVDYRWLRAYAPMIYLVSLAGLQALPEDLYEAARVDGGSNLELFRYITLPLMAPILWLILLLRLVEAFKVFDIPTSLTLGGPGRATEVYSLFTYRTALRFFDHGYAAVQGFLLLFVVMLIVSLLYGRIRGLYEAQR